MVAVLLEPEQVYECYLRLRFNLILNSQGEQNA